MRVVVALGGNALLKRGEPMTAEVQRANVKVAAEALAPIAKKHQLVISHGNGPQVGLLALQGAAYKPDEAYPLDVLGAQTEGMIGYMIEQELGNLLPFEVPFATLLTMVEVDREDPGFENPTKFVGPVYEKATADQIAKEKGWIFKEDGEKWRRVVPSPLPKRIFEIRPIKWLLERGTIVICAGGGGIPTMYERGKARKLGGVEAVIDKDLCSELLARELEADLFVMLTDADAVYLDWGKPTQRAIRRTSRAALEGIEFAAGSMGPKIEAACRFATVTGRHAAIGALGDLSKIIAGRAGTTIVPAGKTVLARARPHRGSRVMSRRTVREPSSRERGDSRTSGRGGLVEGGPNEARKVDHRDARSPRLRPVARVGAPRSSTYQSCDGWHPTRQMAEMIALRCAGLWASDGRDAASARRALGVQLDTGDAPARRPRSRWSQTLARLHLRSAGSVGGSGSSS